MTKCVFIDFRIIESAEALPILCVRYFRCERERERERERCRERERRKWRHHCRAKIGDEFTLSLAKNSHNWRWAYTFPCQKFALFVSPFTLPVSPFTERPRGHHCGAEIRNEFTHSIAKIFSPLLFPLFQMARAPRRVIENPRQTIKSCPVLFCSSHRKNESNWYQKLLEPEKEIVHEVARGDKPYLRKSTDRKAQIRKAFVQFSGLICALRSVDFLR